MDMRLSKLREIRKDREAWRAAVCGVAKNQIWLSDWTTTYSGAVTIPGIGDSVVNTIDLVLALTKLPIYRTEGLCQDREQLMWSGLLLQPREREGPWELVASELNPEQPDRATQLSKTIFPKNIPFLSNQEAFTRFHYIVSAKENFIKCKIQKLIQATLVNLIQ